MRKYIVAVFIYLTFATHEVLAACQGYTISPNGTTIPSATQIVDNNGNGWTLNTSTGKCFENGVNVAGCTAAELVWWNNNIYAGTVDSGWYIWNSSTTSFSQTSQGYSPTGQWFIPLAVWNTPIPSNPTVKSYSAATITNYSNFVGSSYGINTNLDFFTPAFFEAPIGTSTINLSWPNGASTWTMHNVPQTTGICGTSGAVAYFASKGDTDSKVCILDDNTGMFFSVGVANCNSSGTLIVGPGGGGAVASSTGPGWWNNSDNPYIDATGAALCGGIVRESDWSSGAINHAVAMAWPGAVLLNTATFPATTSDGVCTDTTKCMPEGSLIQADPSRTDTQWLSDGVSSADLIIIHALQQYGGYVMDQTGNSAAVVYFQASLGNSSTLYSGAGALPHAVLAHLQIIQGPASPPVPADENRNVVPGSTFVTTP